MSNGNGIDPSGFSDFSDVSSGSSSSDLAPTDIFPSGMDGSSLSNFGSNIGGLMPSTLGGGGQGAGISLGTSHRGKRGYYSHSGALHQHMNPLNPRALRRAISRVTRFEHFAKRVLRITSPHQHVAGFKKHRKRRRW